MTTQAALLAEDVLLVAGVEVTVVPMPPSVSGLCGLALLLEGEACGAAVGILEAEDIPFFVHEGPA